MTIPIETAALNAAYLLQYWADKGVIPEYTAVISGLKELPTYGKKAFKEEQS